MEFNHDANNQPAIPAADDHDPVSPMEELVRVDDGVTLYADFSDSEELQVRRIYDSAFERMFPPIDATGEINWLLTGVNKWDGKVL